MSLVEISNQGIPGAEEPDLVESQVKGLSVAVGLETLVVQVWSPDVRPLTQGGDVGVNGLVIRLLPTETGRE